MPALPTDVKNVPEYIVSSTHPDSKDFQRKEDPEEGKAQLLKDASVGRVGTPGWCQIGYMDHHTGSVINWMCGFLPYALGVSGCHSRGVSDWLPGPPCWLLAVIS